MVITPHEGPVHSDFTGRPHPILLLAPNKTRSNAELLEELIARLEAIPDDLWLTDKVRTTGSDGRVRNCLFGHIFDVGGGDAPFEGGTGGGFLWDWFEGVWATTYMVYPVNDGENPRYPQETPKARCLAYLQALLAGDEKSSTQLEDEYEQDEGGGSE